MIIMKWEKWRQNTHRHCIAFKRDNNWAILCGWKCNCAAVALTLLLLQFISFVLSSKRMSDCGAMAANERDKSECSKCGSDVVKCQRLRCNDRRCAGPKCRTVCYYATARHSFFLSFLIFQCLFFFFCVSLCFYVNKIWWNDKYSIFWLKKQFIHCLFSQLCMSLSLSLSDLVAFAHDWCVYYANCTSSLATNETNWQANDKSRILKVQKNERSMFAREQAWILGCRTCK